jgi:hypothetical protein
MSLVLAMIVALPGLANHGSTSVAGSNFEIDDDANLRQDHPAPSIDWATPSVSSAAVVRLDRPTGTDDDALKGAESTPCPEPQFGTIPNNKSDLREFGIYVEDHATDPSHPGFLHLFWSRVQDPSGTTNMTFEFNQSEETCTYTAQGQTRTGLTPARTANDLLITYDIDRGGTQATIGYHLWSGDAFSGSWGPYQPLTPDRGVGSINTTGDTGTATVTATNFDGATVANHVLGPYGPRTFGEASVDLRAIFPTDELCLTYGSAYVKSRASSSINSQLKDFIAPEAVDLDLCSGLTIRKETDADPLPAEYANTQFDFDIDDGEQQGFPDEFSLRIGESENYPNVLPGTYTITEDLETIDPAFALTNVSCEGADDETLLYDADDNLIGVDVDVTANADVTCTFTNSLQLAAVSVTKLKADTTDVGLAGFEFKLFAGWSVDPDAATPLATATTVAGGGADLGPWALGQYTVCETAQPSEWWTAADPPCQEFELAAADIADGHALTFSNAPLADVDIVFHDRTGYTTAEISCEGLDDALERTPYGAGTSGAGDGELNLEKLGVGDYTCTVSILNGHGAND